MSLSSNFNRNIWSRQLVTANIIVIKSNELKNLISISMIYLNIHLSHKYQALVSYLSSLLLSQHWYQLKLRIYSKSSKINIHGIRHPLLSSSYLKRSSLRYDNSSFSCRHDLGYDESDLDFLSFSFYGILQKFFLLCLCSRRWLLKIFFWDWECRFFHQKCFQSWLILSEGKHFETLVFLFPD